MLAICYLLYPKAKNAYKNDSKAENAFPDFTKCGKFVYLYYPSAGNELSSKAKMS